MATTSKTKKIKNNRNLFFSGVAVLTFTNVLNKVVGMLFRIPISNILGDSGMAYFNAAYHIFVWFYMISTGGLPLAVSILVSEARFRGNREEIKRIYSLTMKMFIVIGTLGTAVMMLLSHQFAFLNGVAGSYLSIIAVAPTLFLVCVASAMRGYFQGFQEMRPTAVSQIVETLGKLLMGILLALGARKLGYGLEVQAACAIAGLTIGTAFGMLFLFISKLRFHEEEYAIEGAVGGGKISGGREILRRLLVIAIPITVSSSIMSLTTMVDDMIINWRLMSIGYVEEYANALYGNYTVCQPPARTYLSHILFTHSAAQGHSYPWRQQAQRGDMPQLSARYRDSGAAVHARCQRALRASAKAAVQCGELRAFRAKAVCACNIHILYLHALDIECDPSGIRQTE